jgi:hypothetical protein
MPALIHHSQFRIGLAGRLFCVSLFAASVVFGADGKAQKELPKFAPESVEFFQKKVHPLLQARCFTCHSKDSKRLEGGLRLDARPFVLKGGDSGAAAIPGEPVKSLIIESVKYESFEMPPTGRLPEGEIAILTKWVELGLPWTDDGLDVVINDEAFPLAARKQSHWAWQPIQKYDPPAVKRADWPLHAVDNFILSRLEETMLAPSPAADRRTLLRRVYFDLIGLPPTPTEIHQFVNDPAATTDALAQVVDELLARPQFGERWARHWLDLVRYAESLGHEFDYPLHHATEYRNYVIRAFNADVPYEQFVLEHLAGDLLETPRRNPEDGTNESIIGTGFWLLGELKHSPVDVKGEEASIIDNQLDVFSKSFLALTVACTRCHDHKFDALTARDYYALSGFIQSSRRQKAPLDPHGKIQSAADRLTKIRDDGTQLFDDDFKSPDFTARAASLLSASREVLFGEPQPQDSETTDSTNRPDVVFADFEGSDFGDWKADGEAFAEGPIAGTYRNQQEVSGFVGGKLVNSYRGNDNLAGTLTSPEFVINRRTIRFLIGGGSFANETCVNLLIGGKVVRTATGRNNEKLDPHVWETADLKDQRAVIQIVDAKQGNWGHVNVDHIVLSDDESPVATRRPIQVVASERNIDKALLNQWVRALSDDSLKVPSHPLFAWREMAAEARDLTAAQQRTAGRLASEQQRREVFLSATELLDDFSGSNADVESSEAVFRPGSKWLATGWAFNDGDVSASHWRLSGQPLRTQSISSGSRGGRLRGVLRSPTFTLKTPTLLYRIAGKNCTVRVIIDGYVMDEFNGLLFGGVKFDVNNEKLHWFRQGGDLRNYVGHRAHIEVIDEGDGWVTIDEIRFDEKSSAPVDPVSQAATAIAAGDAVESQDELARRTAATIAASSVGGEESRRWLIGRELVTRPETSLRLTSLRAEAATVEFGIPAPRYVLALTEGSSEDEHLFIRGSHKNLGEVVPRRMLEAISGDAQEAVTAGSGRLALARRMLDSRNPFPARVMVNRVWQHLFGRGIVETVDNFGVLGKAPTHPELLDFIATQFVDDGWSVKKLIRSLVLSQTYQMDSRVNPAYADTDPQNIQWHRMPIRRLEGEAIRDAMLSVSGRLNPEPFSESVPVYLTSFMQGRGRPGSGPLDGDGRRSVYISIKRNFLSPMMLAFDTPIPFTAIGQRNQSNVPAQALILMNDPFVVQQAQVWAKRELAEPADSVEQRLSRLYERAFSRPASDSEIADDIAFLKAQAESFGQEANWETGERSWSDLCHVLFNVKEFVFVK